MPVTMKVKIINAVVVTLQIPPAALTVVVVVARNIGVNQLQPSIQAHVPMTKTVPSAV